MSLAQLDKAAGRMAETIEKTTAATARLREEMEALNSVDLGSVPSDTDANRMNGEQSS
jgi:hypothetical protein